MAKVRKSDKATVGIAYGEKLDTPLTFNFEWDEYPEGAEGDAELVADKAELTLAEQRAVRDAEAKIKSRTSAQAVAFKAANIVKQTAENNDRVRATDMLKNLKTVKAKDGTRKYTFAEAVTMVENAQDITWDNAWGTSFDSFGK